VRASRTSAVSRREFLADAGVLIVGFSLLPRVGRTESLGGAVEGMVPPPADQLDSWLVVGRDERVTVYAGKVELGTGVSTALRQIVAEEIDVPLSRIAWVQGDSALTVDQGRTVGSGSVKRGGAQLRRAAAEARLALVELAAAKLGVPADRLVVRDGMISVDGDASRRASFGELIGGGKFERTISGRATPKPASAYRVVGQSVPRIEIPAKATGTHVYVHDVRLPGMLHGRVVRPPRVGGHARVGRRALDREHSRRAPGAQGYVRGCRRGARGGCDRGGEGDSSEVERHACPA
jgi:CO/xanthine dehydrogenase Mo-binding subunit